MRINAQKEKTKVLSNVNGFSFSDRTLIGVHLNHFCPLIIFAYEYWDLGSPREPPPCDIFCVTDVLGYHPQPRNLTENLSNMQKLVEAKQHSD